jgi:hypothetical protein
LLKFPKFLFFIQFLATSLLLMVLCMVSNPHQEYQHKILNNYHKILYVDPNFTDEEFFYISAAADEWEQKTQHIVSFTVIKLPQQRIDFQKSILIHKVNQYDPLIFFLDRYKKNEIEGFYDKDNVFENIKIVSFRLNNKTYKQTVLHELGHALGLQHNKGIEGMGTLMYPSVDLGSDHITDIDIENLCIIYHCDAKKLNSQ